ncbi:MAG: septation protein A [Limnobacter sp.]|nr:septation protein A [Limnobacter sp.]
MKLLLDFLPIVLFFLTFKWSGMHLEDTRAALDPFLSLFTSAELRTEQIPILAATVVAILATATQVILQKLMGRPVEKMQWIGLLILVVFGGATLVLQDSTFIKWKPTVLYWAMGLGFLGAHLFGKNPLQLMMKDQVELPRPVWNNLLCAWCVFFVIMGVLNLVVAYRFSTDIWVDFKLFGSLGATLIFVVAQGFYMAKHLKETPPSKQTL